MPEITGLLLAAGKGERYGQHKLLADFKGQALVLHSLRSLSHCDRIIAVIRNNDPDLQHILMAAGIQTVINSDAARGIGHSIACGVRASRHSNGWCILPADMPNIAGKTVDQVADALRRGAPIAAPCFEGKRGHPVGFSLAFAGELMALDGDVGARNILLQNSENLVRIETDDSGVLLDIDTPQDMAMATAGA
jgi:molybdenum cofactor cytidylyltransferase